jgi:hypothetical protein
MMSERCLVGFVEMSMDLAFSRFNNESILLHGVAR